MSQAQRDQTEALGRTDESIVEGSDSRNRILSGQEHAAIRHAQTRIGP